MYWRARKHGDTRHRKYFAWFPVDCDNGMTYWLVRIYEVQRWRDHAMGGEWETLSRLPNR